MDKEQRYTYYIDEYDEFDWCVIDNTTDERYEYLEEITKVLNKQADKIADLEAKLAESEKDRLMWQEMYKDADRVNKNICETDIYPLQEEIAQLKQQLAEKENQTAIDVLQEVKDWIGDFSELRGYEWNRTLKYLNDKIKSLKGDADD